MTKKDFLAIADAIRETGSVQTETYSRSPLYATVVANERKRLVSALADVLQTSNPRFQRARWLAYIAGPNGGTR